MSKLSIIREHIHSRQVPPHHLTHLNLSRSPLAQLTTEMKSQLQKCTHLQVLSLSECSLITLKNLPRLDCLQELDLSANQLQDTEIDQLAIYTKLTVLSLAENKIAKLHTIAQLATPLPHLTTLDCSDNKVASLPNYFKTVFSLFPRLQSLDNRDKHGNPLDPPEEGQHQLDQWEDDPDSDSDYEEQEEPEEQEDQEEQEKEEPRAEPRLKSYKIIEDIESEEEFDDYPCDDPSLEERWGYD